MGKINSEKIFMSSLGWTSTKNMSSYIDNKFDWVLVIQRAKNENMFMVPTVAEFRDNVWYNQNGEVIDETIDYVAYWKSLGTNPNIFFDLKKSKK